MLSDWQYRSLRDHVPAHPLTRRAERLRQPSKAKLRDRREAATGIPAADGAASHALAQQLLPIDARPTTAPNTGRCGLQQRWDVGQGLSSGTLVDTSMWVGRAPVARAAERCAADASGALGSGGGGGVVSCSVEIREIRSISSAPHLRPPHLSCASPPGALGGLHSPLGGLPEEAIGWIPDEPRAAVHPTSGLPRSASALLPAAARPIQPIVSDEELPTKLSFKDKLTLKLDLVHGVSPQVLSLVKRDEFAVRPNVRAPSHYRTNAYETVEASELA